MTSETFNILLSVSNNMLHVITIVLQLLANTEISERGILVVVAGNYFWHLVELDAHLSEH